MSAAAAAAAAADDQQWLREFLSCDRSSPSPPVSARVERLIQQYTKVDEQRRLTGSLAGCSRLARVCPLLCTSASRHGIWHKSPWAADRDDNPTYGLPQTDHEWQAWLKGTYEGAEQPGATKTEQGPAAPRHSSSTSAQAVTTTAPVNAARATSLHKKQTTLSGLVSTKPNLTTAMKPTASPSPSETHQTPFKPGQDPSRQRSAKAGPALAPSSDFAPPVLARQHSDQDVRILSEFGCTQMELPDATSEPSSPFSSNTLTRSKSGQDIRDTISTTLSNTSK
ncbi:hypothetical protein ACM66B_004781 [Microbotryomycetes sp. NB124-2]